jgi:hypothetical protein
MAIRCPQCGTEYDVTLFTFDRSIRCDCGASVDLDVGHQQTDQIIAADSSKTETENVKTVASPPVGG